MRKILLSFMMLALSFMVAGCSSGIDSTKTNVSVIIPGNLGDKSYFDGINRGMIAVGDKYGDQIDIVVTEAGIDKENWEPAIYDAADLGKDIIVTVSPELAEMIEDIAPQYKDVQFIHIDGQVDYENIDLSNVVTIETPPAEAAFVAGAIAANVGNKLGFIGGMDITQIHEFLVPFIQGALYVNPDIKVLQSYTNNWSDAALGKSSADALVGAGADVLFAAAGGAGLGIFDTASENVGIKTIGVDSDQYELLKDIHPDKANTIVSSLVKGIEPVMVNLFTEYFGDGLPLGELMSYGLAEDGSFMVKTGKYDEFLTVDQRNSILDIEQKIIDGTIDVLDVYSMTQEETNNYKQAVVS